MFPRENGSAIEGSLISIKRSEHIKHNKQRENAQGEDQGEERQVQLESASADGALLHQKSYPAVRYPKAIPLANLTGLASFSWKSLLESVHS
jgi:hypothetical protein